MSSRLLAVARGTSPYEWVPVAALVVLAATWGRSLGAVAYAIAAVALIGAVLASVHHAEQISARVGEPFGSLILAVAVTIIEVALIVTLMIEVGAGASSLARDTVFAAVMLTCNGIVGLSLLVAASSQPPARINRTGTALAAGTVLVLAALTLVVPTVFAGGQPLTGAFLAVIAISCLVLYLLFVFIQTVRRRELFLPVGETGRPVTTGQAGPQPSGRRALVSLALLIAALIAVVGLTKVISPVIEQAITAAGLRAAVAGIAIAIVVLTPEALTAARAARRRLLQISVNLALGAAMAGIGLTIPALALVAALIGDPLDLTLTGAQLILLAVTAVTLAWTVYRGRAGRLNGGVHLAVLIAFIVIAAVG